jgi:Flp pilus assembly protein TadG
VSRRDRGSMSLELVIVTPLLVGFMMLMVSLGRIVEAQSQVDGAARDAARAASVSRDRGSAAVAARLAARTTLGERDGGRQWCMSAPTVEFSPAGTNWTRGGQVTIEVSCTIDLSGLSLIAVAPTKTVSGSATAPLDTLRRVE